MNNTEKAKQTLYIDQQVIRDAKKRAIDERTSLSQYIENVVRQAVKAK